MKKIFTLSITLFALAGFILSACAGNTASLEGEWKLVSYGDASNPTPALPDIETSINFGADGQFGGSVGCNTFGAGYQVEGNTVTFEPAFSTMMFCEGTMDQETAILGIVSEKTLNFELSGNQLTLTSQDGSSVMILERK